MDPLQKVDSDPVGSAYPDQPLATTPEATIAEVLQLLRAQQTGAVLVCDGDGLKGIFTERDALKLMVVGADLGQPVSAVMSSAPVTLFEEESVATAIRKMSEGGYRHLPILSISGQPMGVAAVHGIVHYLVDHFPNTVYNLPPNPRSTSTAREGA